MTLLNQKTIKIYHNDLRNYDFEKELIQDQVTEYFPQYFQSSLQFIKAPNVSVTRGKLVGLELSCIDSIVLFFDGVALWLVGKDQEAMSVDLDEVARTLKIHQKGVDPLLRALGAKESQLRVFDFTAGTLRDSIHMIKLGHRVTAFERHPVVFGLLQNGLERSSFRQMIHLNFGEAKNFTFEDSLRPDIVYYDPMFDGHEEKSAKSRKEMELFHQLFLFLPLESEYLVDVKKLEEKITLDFALSLAKKRVIVKRTPKAESLKPPTFQMTTKAVRFDVYQL